MKHELFAMEKSSVYLNDRLVFSEFDMHIYQGEILGIICDSVTEQDAVVSLFRNQCRIDGTVRSKGRKASRPGRAPSLPKKRARKSFDAELFYVVDNQTNLIPTLSIPENICIFADHSSLVRSDSYRARTEECFRKFRIRIDPDRPVAELTNAESIQAVLMKAYMESRQIIVMSRLTEIVTETEFAGILRTIRQMIDLGHTFVIIDSVETNIFQSADEILVIRGNSTVACFEAAFFDRQSFLSYMLSLEESRPDDSVLLGGMEEEEPDLAPRLVFNRVTTRDLHEVSFSAEKGELLKILCLDQRSLDAFRHLIYGTDEIRSGQVLLDALSLKHPGHLPGVMKQGIQWCPESPWQNAVLRNMSIRDNLMLGLSLKVEHLWMKPGYSDNVDQMIAETLGMDHPARKAGQCSPEELQRLVYTRFLLCAPKVLFVEKPFTETDVHIRETTLRMLHTLLRRGITIILLTMTRSDLVIVEGDEYYARDGRFIQEEEMYRFFYEET